MSRTPNDDFDGIPPGLSYDATRGLLRLPLTMDNSRMTSDSGPILSVFERQPYWAPELQRQFAGEPVGVRPCRTMADLQAVLAAADVPVVLLDFEAAPEDCLTWLKRHGLEPHAPAIFVAGAGRSGDLEPLLRELGCIDYLPDPTPGVDLARRVRRVLRDRGISWPVPEPISPFPVAPPPATPRRRLEIAESDAAGLPDMPGV